MVSETDHLIGWLSCKKIALWWAVGEATFLGDQLLDLVQGQRQKRIFPNYLKGIASLLRGYRW
jgi:hypothetical protein